MHTPVTIRHSKTPASTKTGTILLGPMVCLPKRKDRLSIRNFSPSGTRTVKKIITATMTATPISRESTSIARLVRRNCPFRVVFFGMAPASFWISPRHFTIRLPSCQRGDSRSIQRPGRTPPEGQCGAATRRRAGQSQSKDCATGDTR